MGSFFSDYYLLTVSVDYSSLLLGDSNFDGTINILDIVNMINAILGGHEMDSLEQYASDINGAGAVNVLDIVSMIQVILEG